MAAVAAQPSQRSVRPMTCSPIVSRRLPSSIMTTMIGTAIRPLSTAVQNRSFTGSVVQ